MAGIDNLKPFEKGNKLGGRPPGSQNRATILKQLMGQAAHNKRGQPILDKDGNPVTYAEAVNAALLHRAMTGDVSAIREYQDTMHGKMTEETNVNHSFKKMEAVTMQIEGDNPATLSFDIGSDPVTEGEFMEEVSKTPEEVKE